MKNKSKKILLGGGSVLVASSLVGSSMSVNVSADDEGFIYWIVRNLCAAAACIWSFLTGSNGDVKKNNKNNKNDVGTQKTSPKKDRQDQLKVSEEERKKQEPLKKERLECIGNLANKLEEKLGNKIQLSLDGKNGCYFGKIEIDNVGKVDIKVGTNDTAERIVVTVANNFYLDMNIVQKKYTKEEKVDNAVNVVADWCNRVEARMSKIYELAATDKFKLVKNLKLGYMVLYPKNNLKLSIEKEVDVSERAMAVVYKIASDKVCFFCEVNKDDSYGHDDGFFNLCFSSNKRSNMKEKQASRDLSVFNRFVDQIKNSKDSNNITFEVSDENAAVEDNQENLDAALTCVFK